MNDRNKKIRVLFGSHGWPCGLHEVASHVQRLGLAEVVIVPFGDEFERRLLEFRPHVVGLRIEGGLLDAVIGWTERIRELIETTIILGGPTATSHPVEVLEETGADYVFAGDAEIPFEIFLKAARHRDSRDALSTIPGIAYRCGNRSFVNLPAEDCATGRPTPFVDEETLRANRLDWSILQGFDKAPDQLDSLYFTGGRGCPGRCTFCAKLHGSKIRTKTARQLIDEIRGADELVRTGKLHLTSWPLYEQTDDDSLRSRSVSWCSIFDEDFFLSKKRAVEFLQLWDFYKFTQRYRLGFQTNPCSLLNSDGEPDRETFYWISRTKSMIQIGAESFHPEILRRWNKRHTVEQLETVLTALDATGQDYNVFHLQTDYHTTLRELIESTKLLLDAARRHPRMRIASSPYMIPLYDTDIRRELGFLERLRIDRFTDYEIPHPEWMDAAVASLADRIDEPLQKAIYPQCRDEALSQVTEIMNQFQMTTSEQIIC